MAKKAGSSGALLLDTHVLLWLLSRDARLPRTAVERINRASARGDLKMSVMTLWEIGYLVSKGRLRLKAELSMFWREAQERLGAAEVLVSADDVMKYHSLPDGFHGDPGDRFLVAQAMTRGYRFMTADHKILALREYLAPAAIESALSSEDQG